MKKQLLFLTLFCLSFGLCAQMIRTDKTFQGMYYAEYIPKNQNVKGIILYLHGIGEVGKGLDALEGLEIPKLFKNGIEKPYIVIVPNLPSGSSWSKARVNQLLDLVDNYKTKYRNDNIIITGLSMGGIGAFNAVVWANERYERNDYFKAVGIVCGKNELGSGSNVTNAYKNVPLRWWHGSADDVLPASNGRNTVTMLNANGGKASFIEYPGVKHNAWARAYNDEPDSFWKFIEPYIQEYEIPEPIPTSPAIQSDSIVIIIKGNISIIK